MYAIIKTGGKQYRVQNGDVILVELLEGEENNQIEFDDVLFVYDGKATLVGMPKVEGYFVKGEILGQVKGPKVVSMTYKPRKRQESKFGHRQKYSRVKITQIGSSKKSKGENHGT